MVERHRSPRPENFSSSRIGTTATARCATASTAHPSRPSGSKPSAARFRRAMPPPSPAGRMANRSSPAASWTTAPLGSSARCRITPGPIWATPTSCCPPSSASSPPGPTASTPPISPLSAPTPPNRSPAKPAPASTITARPDPANAAYESGIFRLGDRLLAVNRPAQEDNPEILTREQLDHALEGTSYTLLDQAGQANDPSLSRDVWRAFLIAVLFFLISEAILCLAEKNASAGSSDKSHLLDPLIIGRIGPIRPIISLAPPLPNSPHPLDRHHRLDPRRRAVRGFMETQPAPRSAPPLLECLRFLAALAVVILLWQPEWLTTVHPDTKPQIAILWDDSKSMTTIDATLPAGPIRKSRGRLPRRLGEKSPRLRPVETSRSQRRQRTSPPALRHPARPSKTQPPPAPISKPRSPTCSTKQNQPPRRRPAQRWRLQPRPATRRRRPETPPPRRPAFPHPRRQQGPPARPRPSIRHRAHLRHRRGKRADPLHHPLVARPPGAHHRPPARRGRPRAHQGHRHPAERRDLRLHPLALGKGRLLHPRTLDPRGRRRTRRDQQLPQIHHRRPAGKNPRARHRIPAALGIPLPAKRPFPRSRRRAFLPVVPPRARPRRGQGLHQGVPLETRGTRQIRCHFPRRRRRRQRPAHQGTMRPHPRPRGKPGVRPHLHARLAGQPVLPARHRARPT